MSVNMKMREIGFFSQSPLRNMLLKLTVSVGCRALFDPQSQSIVKVSGASSAACKTALEGHSFIAQVCRNKQQRVIQQEGMWFDQQAC